MFGARKPNESGRLNRSHASVAALLCFCALIVSFQNCSPLVSFAPPQLQAAKMEGNGDGYRGKLTLFAHYELALQCADLGANGQSLPNQEIWMSDAGGAKLVRENCTDIEPKSLDASKIVFVDATHISYEEKIYSVYSPSVADIYPIVCPPGLKPMANAVRTNRFLDPLDLLSQNWGSLEGITRSMEKTVRSLPSFKVTRSQDATNSPWLRLDQYVNLLPNTSYSLSAYIEAGNDRQVEVWLYDDKPVLTALRLTINLDTGVSTTTSVNNLTGVRVQSSAASGGRLVQIFFTTTASVAGLDIGFASANYVAGKSVLMSAPQLETQSSICAP